MSKAILVIDMPESCGECMLLADGFLEKQNKWFDKCWVKQKQLDDDLKKPNWCPLKPMPSKMNVNYDFIATCEVTEKVVAMGWNACVEAILGGE